VIKPFQITDLGSFLPNEFSNPDLVLEQLTSPEYEVETMWGKDGLVEVIMCFRNYWGTCWAGFLLISQNLSLGSAKELKRHLEEGMVKRNATRLQTDSQAVDILRKWHRFLGFDLEGTRKKMIFNKDYDAWALMREGV
jgi:hypothetical protein